MKLCSVDHKIATQTRLFYQRAIHTILESGIPVLIGGAYAFGCYTGIRRDTKDLDIWVEPVSENAPRVLRALASFGAPVAGLTTDSLCDPEMVFQIGIEPNRVDILT